MTRFPKVGDRVSIQVKVTGLTKNHQGTVTSRDGEYIYVLPDAHEGTVELYRNELELVNV